VVDDDDAIRDSMRWLLESAGYAVAAFSSAEHFLADHRPGTAACLVLDVRMPGLTGLELQAQLKKCCDETPIIFVTGHGDVPMAVGAVKDGAFDFIEKPFKDEDLLALIAAAAQHGAARRQHAARRLSAGARRATLTPREREVLDRVIAGRRNKQIADDLGISVRTVEIHRARAMEKMGARTIAEVVQMMIETGSPA
jgi:FixJ family two-component response regulator